VRTGSDAHGIVDMATEYHGSQGGMLRGDKEELLRDAEDGTLSAEFLENKPEKLLQGYGVKSACYRH
jgi:hypothetical protein